MELKDMVNVDKTDWTDRDEKAWEGILRQVAKYGAPNIPVLASSGKAADAYVQCVNDKYTVHRGPIRRWLNKRGW